jgi:hypothetical protein
VIDIVWQEWQTLYLRKRGGGTSERQKEVKEVARELVSLGGGVSLFFYLICWSY